jgi:dipeptidyl aminopeptidase/acylaminoacyl peptidase
LALCYPRFYLGGSSGFFLLDHVTFLPHPLLQLISGYVIQASDKKSNHSQNFRRSLPTLRFETIKLSHGQKAHIQMLLPPNFDPKTKHPLLLSIYAGPNSNSVWKRSPPYLDTYFSTTLSAIILKVDGRGSGLRGWNLKRQVYRHLGKAEIEDQLEALGFCFLFVLKMQYF